MQMIDLIDYITGSDTVQFSEPSFSDGMSDPYAPCCDDDEVIAPFLRMCPNETEAEEPSPLDFGKDNGRRSASTLFEHWESRRKTKRAPASDTADTLGIRPR